METTFEGKFTLQLKQDIFTFARKLRLKEYFSNRNETTNEESNEESVDYEYKKSFKKSKSTFIPPAGRDPTLDFYIDAITKELLSDKKKYKYQSNLSNEEHQSLNSLREDQSIVIKKADKGSTIVIMNKCDYSNEVLRQLNDVQYYKKLDCNPLEDFHKEISNIILNSACLNEKVKEDLIPSNEARMPVFYILPKTHKPHQPDLPLGYPGRPIVSGCGSLTENISSYIDSILKPHVEKLPSYIQDTTDFIKKIQTVGTLPENALLVTMDVSSLYSNIHHEDGLEACIEFLRKDAQF